MHGLRRGENGRRLAFALCLVFALLIAPAHGAAGQRAGGSLPASLSDREFWQLVEDSSEPAGFFQSDNLVGNERPLQDVVPALEKLPRGGAYLGVAPDQNYTYILALEPQMAFIVDVRRGNLLEHLMYKAIFELSPTRADFVSRLFSRPRPAGLTTSSTVAELFAAFARVDESLALADANFEAIGDQLTRTHGFALTTADLDAMRGIYLAFVKFGPALTYSSTSGGYGRMPSYAEMMQATDANGRARSYLAAENNYAAIRAYQQKNLIVPIVGDFAGPKALRAVARYLTEHQATVTAFYVSNVEQYLFRNAVAPAFYDNVAALPIDESSVFIRSVSMRSFLDPIADLLREVSRGRLETYVDVTERGLGQ